ncbi:SH3 domain-containing protein [Capnocytophaga canimorsus]|uniref:SH3 domain-containing protein n=1 Tax=Capnocytophaga canimorsus TaxID=28188 RepID=UPI0037D497D6
MKTLIYFLALFCGSLFFVQEMYGQEYKSVKNCGSCKKQVSSNSRVGMICPHCQVRWGDERTLSINNVVGRGRQPSAVGNLHQQAIDVPNIDVSGISINNTTIPYNNGFSPAYIIPKKLETNFVDNDRQGVGCSEATKKENYTIEQMIEDMGKNSIMTEYDRRYIEKNGYQSASLIPKEDKIDVGGRFVPLHQTHKQLNDGSWIPKTKKYYAQGKTTSYQSYNINSLQSIRVRGNLREKPSVQATILTKISAGTMVRILSKFNDWYYVEYNEYNSNWLKRGYVHQSLIR